MNALGSKLGFHIRKILSGFHEEVFPDRLDIEDARTLTEPSGDINLDHVEKGYFSYGPIFYQVLT